MHNPTDATIIATTTGTTTFATTTDVVTTATTTAAMTDATMTGVMMTGTTTATATTGFYMDVDTLAKTGRDYDRRGSRRDCDRYEDRHHDD